MASRPERHTLAPPGRVPAGGLGFGAARTLVLGLARVLFAAFPSAVAASPLPARLLGRDDGDADDAPAEGSLWVLYVASLALVLLGGAFAGLTIALMGQDSIYLQVLSRDDTDPQQKNAKRVHALLQRGKHWVLVTLLLSNVIVNETLPVVLDRCLGGGVAAVVGSTALIVIFGEVLPQSVCVRYGLQIGGIMAKPVLALMWLLAPIAWPTAKVLDHALGQDHGTVYKKSGLKTLVTLHRSLGEVSERLNQDEVTIISAVLDLKEKPVSSVMTPMDDVFTMSEETVLDERMMDLILSAGYSRIPIHEPHNPTNFVGMLLVKILITYDPDDKMRVSEFPLATLPETRPETSCLDLVNFFQEGKSHMVLVSQYPGEDHGALGVVTLEDVIEELIGEEIIDESDVYIDVHKAIRRLQPAPRARPMRKRSTHADDASPTPPLSTAEGAASASDSGDAPAPASSASAVAAGAGALPVVALAPSRTNTSSHNNSSGGAHALSTTVMMRRLSAGADGRVTTSTVPVRANIDEMWQHLRHLGPSNRATNPKNTRSATVKIKTGLAAAPRSSMDRAPGADDSEQPPRRGAEGYGYDDEGTEDAVVSETTRLLAAPPSASASDSRPDYGAHSNNNNNGSSSRRSSGSHGSSASRTRQPLPPVAIIHGTPASASPAAAAAAEAAGNNGDRADAADDDAPSRAEVVFSEPTDVSVLLAAHGRPSVRSGSITENVIETRGIRKVILKTTSSTDADDDDDGSTQEQQHARPRRHRHTPSGLGSPALGSGAGSSASTGGEEGEGEEEGGDGKDDAGTGGADGAGAAGQQPGEGAGKKRTRRKKRKNGH